ncbi:hypothetical protein Tco_0378279 [Tanacetum coccineum]
MLTELEYKEQCCSLKTATIADNVPNAIFDENTFVNPFATLLTSDVEISSLQYVESSEHRIRLDKESTALDVTRCIVPLTVSTMEPKNVKEAMTDLAWIESMQEELLQFKRLDVWVLVPPLDNIKPLTLKRYFLAYAAHKSFIVFQMDVKTAFLHGTLKEDVTCVNLKVSSTA